ncbi:AraC family transcriptional regulator [Nocardia asteroides]|uniref:AraC family transcriptional regulator n=1 Tax=Nocardia asteroides TaxID=1824 RepID=UPI001E2AC81E|nr:helix-turn-helix domain-containing protein [Nocardia asteroides]UGT61600.1 helix-turn-helix domain-containing protein [Nocardia asteroides]
MATPAALPIRRAEFRSADADAATAVFEQLYVGNRTRFDDVGADAAVTVSTASNTLLATDRISSTIRYRVETDPFDYLFVTRLDAGRMTITGTDREIRQYAGGPAALFPLGTELRFDADRVDLPGLRLPLAPVLEAAAELGTAAGDFRFLGFQPVSESASHWWNGLFRTACRELAAPDPVLSNPLVAAEFSAALAASALAVFPNTTMTAAAPSSAAASDTALGRATEYLCAHAAEPVTVADIAAAAGVTPRALQYAFRTHHDTTPLGYLRTSRLQHAHADLLAASAGDGQTVAAIALRWGFSSPGRFAAAYRRRYGQPPARTLRS